QARRPCADGGAEVGGVLRRRHRLQEEQRRAPRAAEGIRRLGGRDRPPARAGGPVHRLQDPARDRGGDPRRDDRGAPRRERALVGREARAALRSLRLRSQDAELNIVGLLLAAGSATRFGSDKLSYCLPHGVPIAVQAARHLHAVVPNVFAVVKPGTGELIPVLEKEGCRVVVCEQAAEGMGASLACAVRAAGRADGYLVALADMPFVRTASIAAVRDALAAGAPLAAPYWRAKRSEERR